MSRRPVPLPNHLTGRPFSTAEALRLGLSADRLGRRDLVRPFHGVRTPATWQLTLVNSARAYALTMPDGWYFSHWTAARLLGLRVPLRAIRTTELHVSSPRGRRSPRGRGVHGHEADAATVELGGLTVSSPVDTWLQLSPLMSLDEAIIMGDGLLRRHNPLATEEALRAAVLNWAGRRGSARLAQALPFMRTRTDSARESELRLLVIRAGLPEPIVNYPIHNDYGAVIAHGDLAFPEYKVLLEYDGDQHREEKQYFIDVDRLDGIMEERWRILRVNKRHFAAPSQLVARIRRALVAAGWRP